MYSRTGEIASVQGISIRRVQQLYNEYKRNGTLHVQKKAGRHKQPLPKQVKYEIIKLYKMYRANASYIGKILRAKGYSIDNNRINQVLKEAGFAMSEHKNGTERSVKKNILIHCGTLIGTK